MRTNAEQFYMALGFRLKTTCTCKAAAHSVHCTTAIIYPYSGNKGI